MTDMDISLSIIARSVKEIFRLVQAFMHSDLIGETFASGCIPGSEVIPTTEFFQKVE
jgi:hypothetical protein